MIEKKIDREITNQIIVSRETGGVDIRRLGEVMEASKLMCAAGSMIPFFLRDNPGGCFAIIWKAYAWGMDPFAVASMAYEVENFRTKERTVAFMSQLIHAIIEARAPIKKRLEVRYEGEGDDRVCIVAGTFRNEDAPREHKSPRLGDRKPQPQQRRNRNTGEDYETISGSPLWQTKPDVQLFYDTSRDWARIYCPDVLLGIYSKEEMMAVGFTPALAPPAAPLPSDDGGLATRLTSSALARAGFPSEAAVAAVDAELAKRDNGARKEAPFASSRVSDPNPLSVDTEGVDVPPGSSASSSPPPEGYDGHAGAGEDAPLPSPPETEESPPRASRGHRRGKPPEPDGQRLV
jgi:hypothetical protein